MTSTVITIILSGDGFFDRQVFNQSLVGFQAVVRHVPQALIFIPLCHPDAWQPGSQEMLQSTRWARGIGWEKSG